MPKIEQGQVTLKEGVDYDLVNGEIVLRGGANAKLKSTAPKFKGEHAGKFTIRGGDHNHRKAGIRNQHCAFVIWRETPSNFYYRPVDREGVPLDRGNGEAFPKPDSARGYGKLPPFYDLADAWRRCDDAEAIHVEYTTKLDRLNEEFRRLADERNTKIGEAIGRE